ncbi:MAG TPA: Fic family protein [Bryobacteraceae bacterium]
MEIETGSIAIFQERTVPTGGRLVGWAALVRSFAIAAPVRRPGCLAGHHVKGSSREESGWRLFDKRYWPGDTFADHLDFALRHEDLDLLIFRRLCDAAPAAAFAAMIAAAPTGNAARRVWFLYEHLTGRTLDIDDSTNVAAVDVLDPRKYVPGNPRLSRRHRVRDNLLGTADFCPIIRRTSMLADDMALPLSQKACETVGRTRAQLIARAASFLLLADSRASFEIEGERPPRTRLERWGKAVVQAGKNPLSLDEILRLHHVLIEDMRFIRPGLRLDGVFLGERDHEGNPLPEFIGARPQDIPALMDGLLAANKRMREDGVDPVVKAAATAFGFVYIHPFEDGNGRLHRCLIHRVLAERKFTPPGMVFPVSSVMLDRIDDYRATLQGHSRPLMNYIEWRPVPEHNVEVTNDTADLYRYFDATEEAEFLYSCVRRAVEVDLPREIQYLGRHDEAMRRIMETVEMPDRLAANLIQFIRQNDGVLGRKPREAEFRQLTDGEVQQIETIVGDAFAGFEN